MENVLQTDHIISKKNLLLWFSYFTYLIILAFSISKHELWGDELHSWNISKNSSGLLDLIHNSRYEGHPPLWYILLFCITKITHDPFYMQCLHFCICALAAYVFIFKCPLQTTHKILILFGYYFIYEYGVLSRNYSTGIVFAFLICVHFKENNSNYFSYYCYLFLLSNTHLLALILAIAFHVYFLLTHKQKLVAHLIYGALLLVPAFYFILPPNDSALNGDFWISLWTKGQFSIAAQTPLKAMSPIPAWWEYHFWNTHFLLYAQTTVRPLKYLSPILSLAMIGALFYIFSKNKRVLLFLTTNLILTLCFALIFPLTSARYVGFIFVGFICALWLVENNDLDKTRRTIIHVFLTLQIVGSIIALRKDWQYKFSHFEELKEIATHIPNKAKVITDYWCLNYLNASFDIPFYCVGFNKEKRFLLWDKEMSELTKKKNVYSEGADLFFKNNADAEMYLITTHTISELDEKDSVFTKKFDLESTVNYSDAIEKGSNIYVYKLSPRSQPSTN